MYTVLYMYENKYVYSLLRQSTKTINSYVSTNKHSGIYFCVQFEIYKISGTLCNDFFFQDFFYYMYLYCGYEKIYTFDI